MPSRDKGGVRPDPYFTPAEDFRDVSRGKPLPHSLPEEKQREVGLTRETWQLEVLADAAQPPKLGQQFTKAAEPPSISRCCHQAWRKTRGPLSQSDDLLESRLPVGNGFVGRSSLAKSSNSRSHARICGGSFTGDITTMIRSKSSAVPSRLGGCSKTRSICRR